MNASQSCSPSPKKSTVAKTTATVRLSAKKSVRRLVRFSLFDIRLLRRLSWRWRWRWLVALLLVEFRLGELEQLFHRLVRLGYLRTHLQFANRLGRITQE